ncbi:MAG TPA: histidine kinase dimerization/phospho-acceptor domain-containing protein, partial [Solirubrobacteraceae bacterium]
MSLRARLTFLVAVLLVVALGAVFLITYRGTGDDVRRQIDQDLRQDETTLSQTGIPFEAQRPKAVAAAVRNYVDSQPEFGSLARLYIIRLRSGEIVTNEVQLVGLAPPSEPPKLTAAQKRLRREQARGLRTAKVGYSTHSTSVGKIRLLVTPLDRDGRRAALVAIGEPLAAVERAKAGVARTFLLAGAIALAIAVIAAFLVATGAVRPLRRMARTAAAVDAGDLSPRMRRRGARDEIRVLGDAFDRMLDRLEDAFARQRRFVSDASHELRTPLTVIRGQLEVLARQPDVTEADVRRVEGLVRTEIVRMERLVEDLLLLARADEGRLVRPEVVDVDPFLAELWEGLALTADRDFRRGPLPGGTIRADPDRIAQVVANLVRNAVEHTQEDGIIELHARVRDGSLELAVDDDGPGIPVEHRDRVFDRFHRTDPARAR